MKQTESDLQIQVVEYLSMISRANNFLFFSIPNESLMMVLTKFRVPEKICYAIVTFFKKMGMLPGVADLCIVKNGKAYFIEMKTNKGVLSENQKLFRKRVWECYGEYEVCRSVEDVQRELKVWGVIG